MGDIKSFQEKLSQSIGNGLTAAVNQYSEFTAMLFDYVESVEEALKKISIKPVRSAHEDVVGRMYESCNGFQNRFDSFAEGVVFKLEKLDKTPTGKAPKSKYY